MDQDKGDTGDQITANPTSSESDQVPTLHQSPQTLAQSSTTHFSSSNRPNTSLSCNIYALSEPNQSGKSFKFPTTKFSSQHERSFHSSWFDTYKWIHYDDETDRAFCFTCLKAIQNKALSSVPSKSDAFINAGFSNWKKALGSKKCKKQTGFPLHEQSDTHREAVTRYIVAPSSEYGNVGDMTSHNYAQQRQYNRKRHIKFLARQSLPLRGNWDKNAGVEFNSNFHQLMILRSDEDPDILSWLEKKQYMSPPIQNDMIKAFLVFSEKYLKTYKKQKCTR